MDTSAAFVVRGEFIFNGALLVDVGGARKRHARASPVDLKKYLDGKAPKDEVAHFYEAQLIHYGLQRSKDKNTAKVRLQLALTQKKLAVPPHLVEMEVQMKKEYLAGIARAKNSARGIDGGLVGAKKRKQSDTDLEPVAPANKKTMLTMKVGDVEVLIDHSSTQAGGREAKTKAVPKSSATASSPSGGRVVQKSSPTSTRKPPVTPKAKKTPRSSAQSPPISSYMYTPTRSQPISSYMRGPTPTQTQPSSPLAPSPQKREPKPEPKVKKEPSTIQWSPIRGSPVIKAEVKPEADGAGGLGIRFITGIYNVSSTQLSKQNPQEANNFRILLCVDNEARKLWGGFQLASKSGVICLTGDYASYGPLSFGWRARDSDRGGLSFGRGCYGELQFFDDRRFKATFFNMFEEPVEVEGLRKPGPLWCGKSAWQFESEWDKFVAEAYGR